MNKSVPILVALLPQYRQGVDGTLVILGDGRTQFSEHSCTKVLRQFAASQGIDIPTLRASLKGVHCWSQALPINKDHYFMPFKTRSRVVGRDQSIGYINQAYLDTLIPKNGYALLLEPTEEGHTHLQLPQGRILIYQPLQRVLRRFWEKPLNFKVFSEMTS